MLPTVNGDLCKSLVEYIFLYKGAYVGSVELSVRYRKRDQTNPQCMRVFIPSSSTVKTFWQGYLRLIQMHKGFMYLQCKVVQVNIRQLEQMMLSDMVTEAKQCHEGWSSKMSGASYIRHTHFSPRRLEFTSSLKSNVTSHFINLSKPNKCYHVSCLKEIKTA